MENATFTTEEVVKEYGTDNCKNYYSKYKKLGGHKDSLHKTLDSVYNNWELIKIKKATHLKYLFKHKNDDRITITTKRLAYELGCFSEVMYEASRKIGTNERQEYFDKMCEIDSRIKSMGWEIFWECTKEVNRLTKQVQTILDDLHHGGLISCTNIYQAVIEHDDGQLNYDRILTLEEIIKVKSYQEKLRQKHIVTYQDIMFNLKSNAVKSYKKDEKAYFKSLGFSRVFETKTIILLTNELEILNYHTKTPLTDTFKYKHIDFAYKLAEKRQDDFHNKTAPVKSNHHLQKIFGGALKKDVYKETSTASEKISMEELLNNEILQLKMSYCYAKSLKEGLNILQIQNSKIEA